MSIFNSKNRYAQSMAYYALNLDVFDMPLHRHDRCEIMYLVDGKCTVEVDGTTHQLQSKQFVFLDQQIPHRLFIERGTPCTLLNYEFRCSGEPGGVDVSDLARCCPEVARFLTAGISAPLLYDRGKTGYALKDLIGALEAGEQGYLLDLLLRRMLLELARCTGAEAASPGISYLKRARQYITDHLCEELNVPQIAAFVGINHSYLQTLFSKQFGCGLMTYVSNQRMDRASFLLKNSNMGITDIAFHVGFNSRQHFGYTFEKRFAMSPKQYRKLNGQNIPADTGSAQQLLTQDGRRDIRHPLKYNG